MQLEGAGDEAGEKGRGQRTRGLDALRQGLHSTLRATQGYWGLLSQE